MIGFYQLFNVVGIMIAFWVNYGCLLHVQAPAVYIVPLALQALPAAYAKMFILELLRHIC